MPDGGIVCYLPPDTRTNNHHLKSVDCTSLFRPRTTQIPTEFIQSLVATDPSMNRQMPQTLVSSDHPLPVVVCIAAPAMFIQKTFPHIQEVDAMDHAVPLPVS